MDSLEADRELIEANGGASVLARKLNYRSQRVQNWTVRGIPPKEKLKHPEIFLKKKSRSINERAS
ncbi:helix-turn-helix domain-containing protein [Acinetobacter sp. ANC 3926]|uniref:helix-turn-helix domain-containing protein n=1 Tax=Acinetobacter genomosp. 15BJ TaxID=106651 RepID=UPI001F4BB97C|nr:helix-turn-helix domain-containing protein [Acinetobacter genomosp. 15BJ]MCH7290987.1 helix-turn-helix domain-containing protein [Acinetobacter genomosp. 15BJ]